MRFLIFFSSLILLTACGDDDGVADAGRDSATIDSGADDAGDDDAGADDAGADDAGDDDAGGDAGDDAGTDDAGADATTNVEITVEDAQAWANCMPIVPADPLRFFIELTYDNSGGSTEANAMITDATLTFDDPDGSTTSIEFDPATATIPAGESATETHSKTTSAPIVPSCSICSGERMMTYDVTVEVDGVPFDLNGTIPFGCTF